MKDWEVTKREIDNLWVQYEVENPSQGGLDTWDKRLIQLAQKKLVGWFKDCCEMVEKRIGE